MSKIIIAIVIIVVVAGLGYWIYQSTSVPQGIIEAEAKNCEVNSDCVVFGEDGDCNCGCFNKNYQWKKEGDCFCAAPKSCKCVSGKCEGVFEESKETAIKNLFADKYDKDASEITIEINQETENHIRGGVVLPPGGPENSGMFLAVKVDDDWKLVHDGQGAVPCLIAAEYNFPADMVKQCVGGDTIVEDRREEACLKFGGQVTTSLCCKSTEDYPNLCLIGPCGCSPENSHQVKICDCGEGKCFNGETCVPKVYSFNDCIKAGYPILESYPRQCKTPDERTFTEGEEHCIAPTGESMSLFEAMQIAITSECGDQLKGYLEFSMCNADTRTWWMDLDIEKEGCNPACVVNIATKEAEINWRCMGLVEPEE